MFAQILSVGVGALDDQLKIIKQRNKNLKSLKIKIMV